VTIAILVALQVGVLGGFIAWRYRTARSIVDPGIFFAANLIILYPARLFALWTFGDDARPSYFDVVDGASLERAGFLAVLGSVAFVAGYLLMLGRRSIALLDSRQWHESSGDVKVVWLFLAMSLAGTAYQILTGDYISYLMGRDRNPAFAHIAYLFSTFQWAAFVGAWILYYRNPRGPLVMVTLIAVTAVVAPYQFIQGSKTFLSLLVLSIFFAFVWTRRRFPALLGIAGVAFVALFVFPYVQQFRDHINTEYGDIPSIGKLGLRQLGELDLNASRDQDQWWAPILVVSGRYAGIDELYNLDKMVPDSMDYRYGKDFLAIAYNVVPRMFWPTKPEYSRGADYGAALGYITSVTPFPYGEALWQFGALGLVPMMMLWGAALAGILRSLDWLFRRSRQKLFVVAIFISQIYWIAGGESSLAGMLSGIPQQIVLYGVVYLMANLLSGNRSVPRMAQ